MSLPSSRQLHSLVEMPIAIGPILALGAHGMRPADAAHTAPCGRMPCAPTTAIVGP